MSVDSNSTAGGHCVNRTSPYLMHAYVHAHAQGGASPVSVHSMPQPPFCVHQQRPRSYLSPFASSSSLPSPSSPSPPSPALSIAVPVNVSFPSHEANNSSHVTQQQAGYLIGNVLHLPIHHSLSMSSSFGITNSDSINNSICLSPIATSSNGHASGGTGTNMHSGAGTGAGITANTAEGGGNARPSVLRRYINGECDDSDDGSVHARETSSHDVDGDGDAAAIADNADNAGNADIADNGEKAAALCKSSNSLPSISSSPSSGLHLPLVLRSRVFMSVFDRCLRLFRRLRALLCSLRSSPLLSSVRSSPAYVHFQNLLLLTAVGVGVWIGQNRAYARLVKELYHERMASLLSRQ